MQKGQSAFSFVKTNLIEVIIVLVVIGMFSLWFVKENKVEEVPKEPEVTITVVSQEGSKQVTLPLSEAFKTVFLSYNQQIKILSDAIVELDKKISALGGTQAPEPTKEPIVTSTTP